MLKILSILFLLTGLSHTQEKSKRWECDTTPTKVDDIFARVCQQWTTIADNNLTDQHSLEGDFYMNPYYVKACISDSFGNCSANGSHITVSVSVQSKFPATFSSPEGISSVEVQPGSKYTAALVNYVSLADIRKQKQYKVSVTANVCSKHTSY